MQSLEAKPLLLDVHSITLRVTHEEFEKLCQDNPERSLELTASGELIIMPPVGGESGNSESELGGGNAEFGQNSTPRLKASPCKTYKKTS